MQKTTPQKLIQNLVIVATASLYYLYSELSCDSACFIERHQLFNFVILAKKSFSCFSAFALFFKTVNF